MLLVRRLPTLLIALLLVVALVPAAAASTPDLDRRAEVALAAAGLSAEELAETGRVVVSDRSGGYESIDVSRPGRLAEVLDDVTRSDEIVDVVVDPPVHATGDPLAKDQWEHSRIGIAEAHTMATGNGTVVAVLDTGVDAGHEDLAGRVLEGYDVIEDVAGATTDANGHGTLAAGMIAAIAGNGIGIAGAAPDVRILPVRVLSDSGSGKASDVAKGIQWASDQGADVINLSLAGGHLRHLETAVAQATAAGAVVVASAGNNGDGEVLFPAGYPESVAVSATDRDDALASFSSYGDHIDLAAPGVRIHSTGLGDRYGTWSGTSAAAPLVSATVAMAFEAANIATRDATRAEAIIDSVTSTALDLGPAGRDPQFGYGRLRAGAAVEAAALLDPDRDAGDGSATDSPTGSDDGNEAETDEPVDEEPTTDTGDDAGTDEPKKDAPETDEPKKDAPVEAGEACPSRLPSGGFTDTRGSVHENYIDCMSWWGITSGVTDTTFAPQAEVNRAQIATFLHRTLDKTATLPQQAPHRTFSDVATGHTHRTGIEVLAGLNVINGTSSTHFSPARPATRGQMASLIVRMHEEVVGDSVAPSSRSFSDIAGSPHEENIRKLVTLGVTTGYADGSFQPAGTVTRGQMATFVMRYVEHLAAAQLTTPPAS